MTDITPQKLNVIILGCGKIAGGFDMNEFPSSSPLTHTRAYKENINFNLQACVDPIDERRKSFVKYWGFKADADTINNLSNNIGSIDIISVCSNTESHFQNVSEALKLKPKLIFCEKPITNDLQLSESLIKKCINQRISLAINYSRRWDPSVKKLAKQIKNGEFGKIRSVVGNYNGGILNNGSHMIDLLHLLIGSLKVVTSFIKKSDLSLKDPTCSVLLNASKHNIPVYLNPSEAKDYSLFELEIITEMGVIKMLSGGMMWQFRKIITNKNFAGYRTVGLEKPKIGQYTKSMSLAVQNIFDHIILGEQLSCTGQDALKTQKVISNILNSSKVFI